LSRCRCSSIQFWKLKAWSLAMIFHLVRSSH
jgi:hypothetical protein